MSTELKSQISRDELLKLLEVYNTIKAAVDDATESLDVKLSTLSDMRDQAYTLREMFDFRPQVGPEGDPRFYMHSVLSDDEKAYDWGRGA